MKDEPEETKRMKYQFMPMFWGDFLANTMHLTPQEAGAYLFLIAHAWEHQGKIAVEDLQRVARVSNHNWHRVRHRVSQFFDTLSDANFWISGRVITELTHAAEISSKRKAAAEQKHNKSTSKSSANGDANRGAKDLHLPSYLPVENLNLGKGREAPSMQVQVNWRDPGVDYRSPPRSKSDAPLQPLPKKLR